MTWDDGHDVTPERSEEELRSLVGAKARRLQMRNRLRLTTAAAAVLALLVGVTALAQDDGSGVREQRVASGDGTSSTSSDEVEDGETAGAAEELTTSTTADPDSPTTTRGPGAKTASTKPTAGTATTLKSERPSPVAVCGKPAYPASATAALSDAVQGVWLMCAGQSPLGTDEIGLEIRSDGTFFTLVRGTDGSLKRRRDWNEAGLWEAVTSSQLNLKIDGSGTAMTEVARSDDRRVLRLDNSMAGKRADYEAAPASTQVTDAPLRAGTDDCTRGEGGEFRPASNDEFRAAMTRVWLVCKKPGTFSTDEDGLEIRSDGQWFKLRRAGDGSLVRQRGDNDHGTWEPSSTMDGSPAYATTFNIASGGGVGAHTYFAARTSKMRLNNMGVWIADYIHAPAGAVVTG